jgi:hypothetical protein
VQARAIRTPLLAAGLAVAATAVTAGCGSGSASSSPTGSAAGNPLSVVKLAAQTSGNVNTFAGTMSLQVDVKPGTAGGASAAVSMSASFAEQVRPSVRASVDIKSMSSAGQKLPGGLSEIVTPTAFYLKWSVLTSELGTGKSWVAIPVSSLSKSSGIDFSQLFGSVQNNGPLTANRLLAAATSVHKAGTGSIGGVAVTEYSGTLSLSKGLDYLSGSTKTQLKQAIARAGFKTATFTVWIDGQNQIREYNVTEAGTSVTETIGITLSSINQPVNITAPPASQTTTLPGSDLSGLAG